MSHAPLESSPIVEAYRARTRESALLASNAAAQFPSGITHDSRHLRPYGVFVDHAQGARKWDVDGHEYVDYFGGHGALLLGHGNSEVLAAVHEALDQGTHFGSNHRHELAWASVVQRLIPSADRLRFTASGTEATHLALRLARAFTGRNKVIRFLSNFHGWHDHMTSGYSSHYDGSPTSGVLTSVAKSIVLLPPGDIEAVRHVLSEDSDIAAVILEPTGAGFGMVPVDGKFLSALREVTEQHNVVLIFDEVVTGFRVSPGGAQAHFDVRPDLTTLAKILAGGLPGAAVVGNREILDALDFDAAPASGREKIQHQGTYNANPVSAAAGTAALSIIETTDACQQANAYGERLRGRLNQLFAEKDVPWAAYGTFSGFHIFTNANNRNIDPDTFNPMLVDWQELKKNTPGLTHKLRLAMLINGVDITDWPGGTISAVHADAELEQTVDAFRESSSMLRAEDAI